MIVLLFGVALWWGAHSFKRWMPERRAALGDRGKALVAVSVALGVLLMIIGYRAAPFIPVWNPPIFFIHINNLLMLIAVLLFALASSEGRFKSLMRHPMLTGMKLFAVAHLLVNGDLASILLFGGLLAWAVITMITINKNENWERPEPGPLKYDLRQIVGGLVVFVLIIMAHAWLGPSPLPLSG